MQNILIPLQTPSLAMQSHSGAQNGAARERDIKLRREHPIHVSSFDALTFASHHLLHLPPTPGHPPPPLTSLL